MVEVAAEGFRAVIDAFKWTLSQRERMRQLQNTISQLHECLDEAQAIVLRSGDDEEGPPLDLGLIEETAGFLERMERLRDIKRFLHAKRNLDRVHELLRDLRADTDAHERRKLAADDALREAERQVALEKYSHVITTLLGEQLQESKRQTRVLYGVILFDLGTHPA
ncbi:hypothetical protein AURDEDRAFT_187136 [Auricularia subglabra TFB-10046 SS5]|uniref:Uncharacterized protein n=1 Tax=Auricularia subglabra (strain TFB-10046 / SS5) TaxID=717982 RepID=J0D252_AURST|nr:hypothetical protein AURDEDRAFT_187136 [Auricularia subglabra TFB-10046 SS5]